MNVKELQKEVHQGARQRGFYDKEAGLGDRTPVRIASLLCLIHSEVSEALEELREDKADLSGFSSELADIIIRTLDLAEWLGIDMEEAIRTKVDYNNTRPHRHGGKVI